MSDSSDSSSPRLQPATKIPASSPRQLWGLKREDLLRVRLRGFNPPAAVLKPLGLAQPGSSGRRSCDVPTRSKRTRTPAGDSLREGGVHPRLLGVSHPSGIHKNHITCESPPDQRPADSAGGRAVVRRRAVSGKLFLRHPREIGTLTVPAIQNLITPNK